MVQRRPRLHFRFTAALLAILFVSPCLVFGWIVAARKIY